MNNKILVEQTPPSLPNNEIKMDLLLVFSNIKSF